MALKAIIVDDEDLARKNLMMLLEEYCKDIEVIGDAGNIDDAELLIEEKSPDVVFLDIRMPSGAEGFDLLDRIKKRNFLVVFVTAFKDYALRAFNANAIHYVLKPVDIDDLVISVDKVLEARKIMGDNPTNFETYFESIDNLANSMTTQGYGNKVAISHTKGIKLIDIHDIMYLEASGNCTVLYFNDGTRYLDTRTLKIYEGILNPAFFFRIHKSHIVNMEYLKEYLNEDGHFAILKNGKLLSVARNRVSNFVKTLKSL
ncbi:LytR/AlgR family response regulator transcription factor [Crocinitomix catalasitica]|mgnify:CR=1 FL=1|uniref:LytR/AlgR family response regulator transcription factor n=1 Tax=Crocinitomix catalasitica TaxID=184607 RepID=UPI0004802C12|nr:LytTR family DNA-binding domain-containing protein [Crocinitomix catalasitica]